MPVDTSLQINVLGATDPNPVISAIHPIRPLAEAAQSGRPYHCNFGAAERYDASDLACPSQATGVAPSLAVGGVRGSPGAIPRIAVATT